MVTTLRRNDCCFNVDAVGIVKVFLQIEHPGIVFQNHLNFQKLSTSALHIFYDALVNSQSIYQKYWCSSFMNA
jgi:hypothetical protein